MAEYIDKEALRDALYDADAITMNGVKILNQFPSSDVEPVRHGKWMPFHAEFAGDIQYCSVCEIGFAYRTSYCPHCGAVMDGWRAEGEEND